MKQKAKILAEKIATEILTVYLGADKYQECTRAQLMLRQADGTERNMGGRNKASLTTVILDCLAQTPRVATPVPEQERRSTVGRNEPNGAQ